MQLCHINMIKPYYERGKLNPILAVDRSIYGPDHADIDPEVVQKTDRPMELQNSEILADFSSKLDHLAHDEKEEMTHLIRDFPDLFPDVPKQTYIARHDVGVGNASPTKRSFFIFFNKEKYIFLCILQICFICTYYSERRRRDANLYFLLSHDLLDSSREQRKKKKKKKRKKKTVWNGLASQPPSPICLSQLALNSWSELWVTLPATCPALGTGERPFFCWRTRKVTILVAVLTSRR